MVGDAVLNDPAPVYPRDTVFVSYCHDDRDWRRKFIQILAPLVRNRQLALWDDTHIPVGDDWQRNISDGVRRAQAALLLVSGSYLASPFIMEEELPALIEHGVRLIPVLVDKNLKVTKVENGMGAGDPAPAGHGAPGAVA
jgi:hypothetical protein